MTKNTFQNWSRKVIKQTNTTATAATNPGRREMISRVLHLANLPFDKEEGNKTFLGLKKNREIVSSRPALQEILKRVL